MQLAHYLSVFMLRQFTSPKFSIHNAMDVAVSHQAKRIAILAHNERYGTSIQGHDPLCLARRLTKPKSGKLSACF
jgi:hypothetical protein